MASWIASHRLFNVVSPPLPSPLLLRTLTPRAISIICELVRSHQLLHTSLTRQTTLFPNGSDHDQRIVSEISFQRHPYCAVGPSLLLHAPSSLFQPCPGPRHFSSSSRRGTNYPSLLSRVQSSPGSFFSPCQKVPLLSCKLGLLALLQLQTV